MFTYPDIGHLCFEYCFVNSARVCGLCLPAQLGQGGQPAENWMDHDCTKALTWLVSPPARHHSSGPPLRKSILLACPFPDQIQKEKRCASHHHVVVDCFFLRGWLGEGRTTRPKSSDWALFRLNLFHAAGLRIQTAIETKPKANTQHTTRAPESISRSWMMREK